MCTDHIPDAGNEKDKASGRAVQKLPQILGKLTVEHLHRSIVYVAYLELRVLRVYERTNLTDQSVRAVEHTEASQLIPEGLRPVSQS